MLLTIILLQRKRLHSKLNFELCMSVLKLGKPSSKSTEVTLQQMPQYSFAIGILLSVL